MLNIAPFRRSFCGPLVTHISDMPSLKWECHLHSIAKSNCKMVATYYGGPGMRPPLDHDHVLRHGIQNDKGFRVTLAVVLVILVTIGLITGELGNSVPWKGP